MLFLVLILFLCTHVLSNGDADHQFVYNGFAGANLLIDDSAVVTPDGLLLLTNGTNWLRGHAVHPPLLHFRSNKSAAGNTSHHVPSFSTTFVFAILSEYADLSADGLAFFIAPTNNLSATLSCEYLGLFNMRNNGNSSNHILAVEIDTRRNVNFGDIDSNHVGIDINGLNSVKAASAGYHDDNGNGAFRELALISGEAMQVWADYDSERAELSVTLAPAQARKPRKPLLSHHVDLSTVIAERGYVGFAASLGDMSSRHCILGWSFSLNGPAPPLNYTKLPKLPNLSRQKHLPMVLITVIPIATMMFILAAAGTAFVLVRRRIKYAELHEDWEDEFGPQRFSYKVLFHATDGFGDEQLLGVGGFGRVYKGKLPASDLEVAVKRVSHDSRQGIKEFIAEIASIGRLEHRNLVRLLGYCRRRHELLLVYEYLRNGSLDKYLHNQETTSNLALDWDTRFRIIRGVALALCYLHENCEKVVIHRDIKASNVLLDDDMNGRLGDFGLAKLYDHGTDPHTTRVVGTIGYLAPELARTSKATPLTDVFAFGMFLLEVACGRRPIMPDAQDDEDHACWLVDWVLEQWGEGGLTCAVDARLQGKYSVEEASLVLKLGLLCSRASPSARPAMRQIVQYLEGSMPLPELLPTSPHFGTLAFLGNDGFEPYPMSYDASSASSCILESVLSGGR